MADRYYSTLIMHYVPDEVLEKYGVKRTHKQFRIVCKAKSRAAAERYVKEVLDINGGKVFDPNYTSETGNKEAIDAADKFTGAISLGNMGSVYHDMKEIHREIEEFRNMKN